MSSAKTLPYRNRHFRTEEIDLDLPTSQPSVPPRKDDDDDDAASNYESSAEDTIAPPAPHTLLVDDPFSTEISKILFESIGADLPPCIVIENKC